MSAPWRSGGRTRRKAHTRAAAEPPSRASDPGLVCSRDESHQIIHQIGVDSIAPFADSQARNAFVLFNRATDRVPPLVVNLGNSPAKGLFVDPNLQFVAADFPKLLKWNFALAENRDCVFEVFRPDRDDDSRLRFVKQYCSRF